MAKSEWRNGESWWRVVDVVDVLDFEKMQGADQADYGLSRQRWPFSTCAKARWGKPF